MSLIVKNKFVVEDIIDEKGMKIGELKFNPSDSRIMYKLSQIITDATNSMNKIKTIGNVADLSNKRLETIEDFENVQSDIEKICKGINIETDLIDRIFANLNEVFGKETIEIFTGGTQDIELLMPLLEFVMPYVKEARQKNVKKYIKSNKLEEFDVLE
ncbi:MAG: hypothetical protein MR405_07610 [Mollicutes bacterium]|nr:hypothetical protein [Mollicutes bacterium]